jgi:exopolysaccharide biosynthesis polyprenyl glycosylphosphotransferase
MLVSETIHAGPFPERLRLVADKRALALVPPRRESLGVHRRGWLVRRALVAADLAGLFVAFALTELILGASHGAGQLDRGLETMLFGMSLPVWVILAKVYGLYDRDDERTDHSTADDVPGIINMLTIGSWMVFATVSITGIAHPTIQKVVVFWLISMLTVFGLRAVARARCRQSISYLQNTVIVGAGEVGQGIARKYGRHPEYGINLVGFIDAAPRERLEGLQEHVAILGPPEDLAEIVRLLDVERVVFAFSNDDHETTLGLIRELHDLDVQIDVVPRLFEIVGTGVDIHTIEGMPLLGMRAPRLSSSSIMLKRSLDIAISLPALVILAPLLVLAAILIKLDSPGPVFFRQVRMGCRNRTFRIWKLRTMQADADSRKHEFAHLNMHLQPGGDPRMFKIEGDPRVTRVGAFLRRTSIDELPQLFNVLCGEMSIVGSRPLILEEDIFVEDWRRRRLDLKPGITGLWQVAGRSHIPFDEMVTLDYLYVTNWSIWHDLRLIFRTVPLVFVRCRHAY